MTSAVGGGRGSPKSREKEQNQLICDSDKGGEGVKKSEIFADVIYGNPLRPKWIQHEEGGEDEDEDGNENGGGEREREREREGERARGRKRERGRTATETA